MGQALYIHWGYNTQKANMVAFLNGDFCLDDLNTAHKESRITRCYWIA